jgi:hypothetical protein
MKMILTAIAILALSGCAMTLQPVPGVEIGFDASPEAVGGTVAIDPKAAGCESAKAISWNWLEKQLCDETTE